MFIINYQFENIHPFYNGNRRKSRIINILFLIHNKLQNLPIQYLNSYIIRNRSEYYRLPQKVRETNSQEKWLLFVLYGKEQTSKETIDLILKISDLMISYKHKLRDKYKFVSQVLLINLFKYPYAKIEFIVPMI